MTHFTVRLIRPDSRSVESGSFEIGPRHEQAVKLLAVMKEFLRNRPPQFRDRLSFVTRGDLELEWLSAPGGVAFATIYEAGQPVSLTVLLSGLEREADLGMITGYRRGVLEPLMGTLHPDEQSRIFGPERPLVLCAALPGQPELAPTLHLLNTTLACAFYQAVQKMSARQ